MTMESSWADQPLSDADYAKINSTTTKFDSLQKMAQALNAACKVSSSQADQQNCLAEGDKWILHNLLGSGERIPCTASETEFDIKGMLSQACANTFHGADDNDQAFYVQMQCLLSPNFAQVKAQPYTRDWIFYGLTKSQDGLSVPGGCKWNITLRLGADGNSFGVEANAGPGYDTTYAAASKCLSSEIAQEKALLVTQQGIDKMNPAIQGDPSTASCESVQNFPNSGKKSTSVSVKNQHEASTGRVVVSSDHPGSGTPN